MSLASTTGSENSQTIDLQAPAPREAAALNADVCALRMASLGQPWAIEESAFRTLEGMLNQGMRLPAAQGPEAPGKHRWQRSGDIAVISMSGIITGKTYAFLELFGITQSSASIASAVRNALADAEVRAVVLDVDSPGGQVFGTIEAAAQLSASRSGASKPIVAVSDHLMASAAYWLASSAAHEIAASPSSMTGSIGVITMHVNAAGLYEQLGLEVELITAGRYKAELLDTAALTDAAREHVQSEVDHYYGLFLDAVARARGTSASAVRSGYGEGRVLTAEAARKAGLVDRVATLQETLARLQSSQARTAVMRGAGLAESVINTLEELEIASRDATSADDTTENDIQARLRARLEE